MKSSTPFKKLTIVAILLFSSILGYGQNFYFPKPDYADSSSVQKSFSILAGEVLSKYKKVDNDFYFNSARLQIVSGDYSDVNPSLDNDAIIFSSDTAINHSSLFIYRVFSKVMLNYPNDNGQFFYSHYEKIFRQLYQALSPAAEANADIYFKADVSQMIDGWNKKVNALQKNPPDSLSITDAINLCVQYCRYLVFTRTEKIGNQLIARVEQEDYDIDDSVLVKMPGGETVSLTVVRNKKLSGKQPVVLMYSIYTTYDHAQAKTIATKGYIGIIADTRGKRLSENNIEPFEHDAADAWYIIDWISKQPWCNGKVGMYGGSYLGFSQWSATKYLHPALKTIVPEVAVGAGIDYPMQNSVFMSYMLKWLHLVTNNKNIDEADFDNTAKWNGFFEKWYRSGQGFRSLDTMEGRPVTIFQRWLKHPAYDAYWKSMTPQREEFSKINIPILTITGYWDADQLGAMYYYRQHHLWNKAAEHYLIIGPYDHHGGQGDIQKQLLGYIIDPVADIPIDAIVFQWFDHVLKGAPIPTILSDKVNYQVMGTNTWKHVPALKNMNNDTLTFYMSNGQKSGNYKLSAFKPLKTGFIKQEVNFKDTSIASLPEGDDVDAFDTLLTKTIRHSGKMVFVSDTLKNGVEFSGTFKATIAAAINKKDMDIVIDLYILRPDGTYLALNQEVQRASFAKDRSKRILLHPNQLERIELKNTFLTSVKIIKGSRIVAVVGVNRSQQWQINYGTGKDVSAETSKDAAVPLEVKWYNTSMLKIPVFK